MKTRKLSKSLAILLALVLVMAMLPMSAMAVTISNKNVVTYTGDSNVDTATITGTNIVVAGCSAPTTDGGVTTSVVSLSPNSTGSSATITLKKGTTTVGSTTVALTAGEGTAEIVVSDATYAFTFQKEASYVAATYGNSYIAVPSGEGVTLSYKDTTNSNGHPVYNYTASATTSGYPFPMSLRIIPGGTGFDSVTSYEYSYTSTATLTYFSGTYFLASFPSNNSTLSFSIKKSATDISYYTIKLTASSNSGTAGSGIVSYLPAPGQFTNEGIGTGGWGDVYQSGSSNFKVIKNGYTSTGVSLGAFGGSIVLDFGTSITDNPNNPYGIDFIVYGNAFSTNAEPGCIQVAPDANNDGKPDKWYDIAGSLYYNSTTDKNCTIVYANPTPADNTSGTSVRANVPYADSDNVTSSGATQTWSTYSTLTTNTFHNHSWFPLARNYFDATTRTATNYTSGTGWSAHLSALVPAAGNTPIVLKEGQTVKNSSNVNIVSSATTTLAYSGVNLNTTSTNAGDYTFGYADVHANGTPSSTAVNPYTSVASTTGGDGIDIAWAVNSDGSPAGLTSIRYVRIYTGVMRINGPFGEISTEVTGVYAAAPNSSSVGTTATPTISVTRNNSSVLPTGTTFTNGAMTTVSGLTTTAVDVTVTGASGFAGKIFINGVETSSGSAVPFSPSSSGEIVQIIVQDGTAAPYIVWLNLKAYF